jgi:cyclopropane fatty-acyl-phospholipid synthase-like methyltransferase
VVRQMLRLARVSAADTVYDLGCGDGRILTAAARLHGARGVGVELDPALAAEARAAVAAAGVGHLVRIEQGDAAAADVSGASVVALYLSEGGNASLLRAVSASLAPGTRVVSFYFPIPGWEGALVATDVSQGVAIHLYSAPGRGAAGARAGRGAAGEAAPAAAAAAGDAGRDAPQ